MKKEAKYQFREFLDQVHRPHRRNPQAKPLPAEIVIDQDWQIVVDPDAAPLVWQAARDLQDYLLTSMNISLPIRHRNAPRSIVLTVKALAKKRSYNFEVTRDRITISGHDPAGTAQGVYYFEDLCNLREAPFLVPVAVKREPLFSPRMTHSGWDLDQFPDSHLNLIAHYGFDSILVFVKGPDRTKFGVLDFNDLIRRAAKFGLDVYFYSYLNSFKHPDDADAEDFFDKNFGRIFQHAPGAKGLILVGESTQFPSKDPASHGGVADASNKANEGIADARSAPGWWPCSDYPQWLNAVKKAVRRYAPEADIVFWTYNWGRAPEAARIKLIEALPPDVSLEVTFEMFEQIKYPNHMAIVPDYTITFPGPGHYFTSEAAAASRRHLPLYTMANTAGTTWDLGVSPYIPTPQQWFKRFAALHDAQKKWQLSGLMESHHNGWYPSPVSECAKWSFWSPDTDMNEILARIAQRDFGPEAAPLAVAAWQLWSDAINTYTPGFDDQNGPLRIGCAYPLVFHPCLYPHTEQHMKFPVTPNSIQGLNLVCPFYNPEQIYGQTACGRRVHEDIIFMSQAEQKWGQGVELMRQALAKVPESKLEIAGKLAGIGEYFHHALRTLVHVKKWWVLNKKLEIETDFDAAGRLMDEMTALAMAEAENVRGAIPLAEADSRLGWEPTMDYMAGPWHLEWKLRQLDNLMKNTLPGYRKTLSLTPPKNR